MASEISKRDENSVAVLTGVTDDANLEIRMLRVNPTTGRLLVSSLSGGTSILTSTSGSVNGTNAVFVYTSAPILVIVDQQRTMQKTSSDGTVNWTGTTTITLTIAPNFDLIALG